MVIRLLRRTGREPDPTHLAVEVDGISVLVALNRRAGARRMTLRVSSVDGGVALTLPPRVALETARDFLSAHSGWIAVRLARLPDRVPFRAGNVIPVRDLGHRILADPERTRGIRTEERDGAPVLAVGGDEAGIPGRVQRFLGQEAKRDLQVAVARYTGALGVRAKRLTLRDTRSRWGSCSSTGGLSFSWRLVMAPPLVLDYLAAHEVVHLREMNHSARFWHLLREVCPGTNEAEAWLKRHGTGLHRYG